jgi:hypothetical protein
MKPIIFSTPMVQAILDGRKTMTRRVIKDKDITNNFDIDIDGSVYAYIDQETGDSYTPTAIAKYQVGDILWVRETWSKDENGEYVYRANYGTTEDDSFPPSMFKWKPSIHMPREAARIFLKVTNVRVERLQDITPEQSKNEGVDLNSGTPFPKSTARDCHGAKEGLSMYQSKFVILWDSTIKKQDLDKYSWEANPWVWVYEFERVNDNGSRKDK